MTTYTGSSAAAAVIAVGLLSGLSQSLLADDATSSFLNESCAAQCQATLDDCKQQCVEVGSGKIVDDKGEVGQQSGSCIDRCQADFDLCQKDC